MSNQRDLFKRVAALAKQGQAPEALDLLHDALRRGQLDPEDMERAGRVCQDLFVRAGMTPAARVLVLGQCTTSWVSNALAAVAWSHRVALAVVDGAYDNVMQELLARETPLPGPPGFDVVVLLPWNQRLLSPATDRSTGQRVEDERAFWQQAWQLVTERLGARVQQIGYDWSSPGVAGYSLGRDDGGDAALVGEVNRSLREHLPGGAVFTDLERISGMMGRERFYDPRRYLWTKQPFSEAGTVRLAEHVWAGIRAVTTGPKKVLVLDLDNTLWGGVVGETGPLGIELGESPDGEAYRAFQKHAKRLTDRGVLLAVCSKNNPADARGAFELNPRMVLSLDDFAQFEASWEPKAVAIERIARTLQLGLDSFVFFDDNPAEREHVRQALGEVAVVEAPQDPSEYVRALEAGLWFESVGLTGEDRARVGQYRVERQRREAAGGFDSLDSYLASLAMVSDIRTIDETDLDRVVQLIGKTNQFNLTSRRHGTERVRQLLRMPGTIGLSLRLSDRFGDHGLVSVLLAVPAGDAGSAGIHDPQTLEIDTWLMSCRVIGRTAEHCFFNALLDEARRAGVGTIVGRYAPTAKNALVKDLYDGLGFTRRSCEPDGTIVYDLDVTQAVAARTSIQGNVVAPCGTP